MSSLYEKSVFAFCKTIDIVNNLETVDNIYVLSLLPVTIQRDIRKTLKRIWFRETSPPENPYNFEYRYLDIYCLDRSEFIMLLNHPLELRPEFLPYDMQSCHISFNYYEFSFGSLSNQNTFVLCQSCFEVTCSPTEEHDYLDFDYQTFWSERNWKFYNITRHYEISVDRFINQVIKQENSWCDKCIFKPLFQYLDCGMCTQLTHNHDYDNSSDSDVSVVTSHSVIELYDPFRF